jgi:hypothetical protein
VLLWVKKGFTTTRVNKITNKNFWSEIVVVYLCSGNQWPEEIKNRIQTTYAYIGGSVVVMAGAAALASQSPEFINPKNWDLVVSKFHY